MMELLLLLFFLFLIKNQDKIDCFSKRRVPAQLTTLIVADRYWMGESNCKNVFSAWLFFFNLKIKDENSVHCWNCTKPLSHWSVLSDTLYIGIPLVLSCAAPPQFIFALLVVCIKTGNQCSCDHAVVEIFTFSYQLLTAVNCC